MATKPWLLTALLLVPIASATPWPLPDLPPLPGVPAPLPPLPAADEEPSEEWVFSDSWISPVSELTYAVYKRPDAGAYEFRLGALAYDSWQAVVEAELAAQPLNPNLYKASKALRERYLAALAVPGDEPVHLVLVLREQPVVDAAGPVWASNRDRLAELEARVRAEAPSPAGEESEASRELREALDEIRRDLDNASLPAVEASQTRAATQLAALGVTNTSPLSVTLNGLIARTSLEKLEALADLPTVAVINEPRTLKARLDTSVPTTGQATFTAGGYVGGAYDVAVADTGADFTHPALSPRSFSQTRTWFDWGEEDPCFRDNWGTDDLHSHGTHVIGIVGSLGSSGWANNKGMMTGSGTGLMNLKSGWKNCDGDASMDERDAFNNFDWAIRSASFLADALSLSFGGGNTDGNDNFALYLDAVAYARNLPVAVAAGNDGPNANTVGSPATGYNMVAVGNADNKDTSGRGDDVLRSSSSRGTTSDGRLKPDLIAPGTNVYSANHHWENNFGLDPDFVGKTGTSMATPHVAGAFALLKSAGITDTLKIKATLLNSADKNALGGAGVPNNDIGHGYLDLTTHYDWYKTNNFYTSGTLTAEGQARFVRLNAAINADRITLYWQRHVQYNNANPPVQYDPASDLDLRVYEENTNALKASAVSTVNNYEFLRGSDFGAIGNNVIKVKAFDFAGGVTSEPWGLAGSFSFTTLSAPVLAMGTPGYPARLRGGNTFTLSVSVRNDGGLWAHNVQVDLGALPAGFSIAAGNDPQNVGALTPGQSKTAQWTINVPNPGACATLYSFGASASTSSYGESFTAPTSTGPGVMINCPPTVTVTSPDGGEKWRATRTLSWTATDGNGDALTYTTQYSSDGGATWSANICAGTATSCAWNTLSVGDGTAYRIRTIADDTFATGSDTSNANFVVDNTPPVTSSSLGGTAGPAPWFRSSVTVALTCADPTAGCSTTTYNLDGGATTTYGGPFTVAAQGSHTVVFRSTDQAGNAESDRSTTFSIDSILPATSLSTNCATPGDPGWCRTTSYTYSGSASDSGSGLAAGQPACTRDGGGVGCSGSVAGQGSHSVVLSATDVAGNIATRTANLGIDTVAPNTNFDTDCDVPGNPGWCRSPSYSYTGTSTDPAPGSGVAGGQPVCTKDGAGAGCSGTVNGQGAHTLGMTTRDVAGNTNSGTKSLAIDSVAPAGTVTAPGLALGAYVVSWSASDGTSGLAGTLVVEHQKNRNLPVVGHGFQAACTAPVSGNNAEGTCTLNPSIGEYCYRIRVTDAAGNTLTTAGDVCTKKLL